LSSMSGSKGLVLVTGVGGFVGSHVALTLLEKGYRVRGTVRSIGGPATAHLTEHPKLSKVELVTADLMADEAWPAAVAGCDAIMHTASPFPFGKVEPDSLVKPALGGTERVLNAAAAAGIKRVVLTSSVVSVSSGRAKNDTAERVFTEEDWSNSELCDEYPKSKTLAEKKAWELAEKHSLQLTTINPSYVLGPILSERDCTSLLMVQKLLSGAIPATPRIWIVAVDVRDVAMAHVSALEKPESIGKRYILDNGDSMWMPEIAGILGAKYRQQGFPVPKHTAPYFLVALLSLWDKEARTLKGTIGVKSSTYNNSRVKQELLDNKMYSMKDTLIAMADSLIEKKIVVPK